MARLPVEEQQKAVERHFPGWQLVEPTQNAEPDAVPEAEPAEARSPDIDELRRRFLGHRTDDSGRRTLATRSAGASRPAARGRGAAEDQRSGRGARSGATRRSEAEDVADAAFPAVGDVDAPGAYEDTVVTIRAQNAYDDAIGAPGDKKVILSGEDGAPKYAQG